MRVVFMGTPDFAVPCLTALLRAGHEVAAVVTQPDRPKGRSGKLSYPPVKEAALLAGIPVYQPKRVREAEFQEILRRIAPEVIVVVAFGQILPVSILELPKYGCINVHASLLPKYRGAAPIQWAILCGEKKSGVTTMQMDAGLDTGDILLARELELAPKETGGSLFDKLSVLGAEVLLETLKRAKEGSLQPVPQGETDTVYASMLSKDFGKIDFHRPAEELERLIRGLTPWPGTTTCLNGKALKLWEADVEEEGKIKLPEGMAVCPGMVLAVEKDSFLVACGPKRRAERAEFVSPPGEEGNREQGIFAGSSDQEAESALTALVVHEVQLEGKKRMDAGDFLRGCRLTPGMVLGDGL